MDPLDEELIKELYEHLRKEVVAGKSGFIMKPLDQDKMNKLIKISSNSPDVIEDQFLKYLLQEYLLELLLNWSEKDPFVKVERSIAKFINEIRTRQGNDKYFKYLGHSFIEKQKNDRYLFAKIKTMDELYSKVNEPGALNGFMQLFNLFILIEKSIMKFLKEVSCMQQVIIGFKQSEVETIVNETSDGQYGNSCWIISGLPSRLFQKECREVWWNMASEDERRILTSLSSGSFLSSTQGTADDALAFVNAVNYVWNSFYCILNGLWSVVFLRHLSSHYTRVRWLKDEAKKCLSVSQLEINSGRSNDEWNPKINGGKSREFQECFVEPYRSKTV